MQSWMSKTVVAALLLTGFVTVSRAVEVPTEEWERMKSQISELQARGSSVPAEASAVDTALDSKYGPNSAVTTKTGKLTIGGLLQVWYVNYDKGSRGLFDDPAGSGIRDSSAADNINSFAIRRAQISFTADINEQISGTVMIDPAREFSNPSLPVGWGNYKTRNSLSPESQVVAGTAADVFDARNGIGARFAALQDAGTGVAGAPRLLQDAYINWHNCLPYHDITIGQFKPGNGEEGLRNDGELDFIERSMVGFQGDTRDLGLSIHGSYWGKDCYDRDGRFQYSFGVFNGAGSYLHPGEGQNRTDNNQSKDFNARMLVRPVWNDCIGRLELGVSYMGGHHGQTSGQSLGYYNPLDSGTPQWGVDRPGVWASRFNAWTSYRAGSIFSGAWLRSEYTFIKDADYPLANIDYTGGGSSTNANLQDWGRPTSRQGIYGAVGFRFADSCWASDGGMPCWLKPVELAARYEMFQDVATANQAEPLQHVQAFYTKVATVGLNYYIKGHNAKVQANYNFVQAPMDHQAATQHFNKPDLNNFALNFQVAF